MRQLRVRHASLTKAEATASSALLVDAHIEPIPDTRD